jgi:hypothetical protein
MIWWLNITNKNEGDRMFVKREIRGALLIALLCVTFGLTSSTMMADTHLLSNAAESRVVGRGDCDDILGGAAIGLGIGTLFGCAWCPVGAIAAKGLQMLFC